MLWGFLELSVTIFNVSQQVVFDHLCFLSTKFSYRSSMVFGLNLVFIIDEKNGGKLVLPCQIQRVQEYLNKLFSWSNRAGHEVIQELCVDFRFQHSFSSNFIFLRKGKPLKSFN